MDYNPADFNMTQLCYETCYQSFDCALCAPYLPPTYYHPPPDYYLPLPPPTGPVLQVHTISIIISFSVFASIFLCSCWMRYRAARQSAYSYSSGSPTPPTNTIYEDHYIIHVPTVGLGESVLNSIDVHRYKKGESGLIEGTECAVCLSEFCDGEDLRVLPKCRHAFHVPCIDMWLKSHVNCPLCRSNIVSDSMILASKDPSSVQSVSNSTVESRAGNSSS